jgi:2-oxo-4-hydroxy-4-carboxy--5-ureidoimidazoline (OHCU) decarboxylase
MTEDEYRKLIEEYMDQYNIPYIDAIQLIMSKQIERLKKN